VAEHNEDIKPRHLYLAVPDKHLLIKRGKVLLGSGPVENRWRPSIDTLFRSAAVAYDGRTIGVILTGMLDDGTAGMQVIKECGGTCIVQDPSEAEYPDMPQSVMRNVKVDYCTTLQRIAIILQEKTRNGVYENGVIPPRIAKEAQIAERVALGIEQVDQLGGERSPYSCPECGGATWELKDGGVVHYRCHTGHVFSENELLESKRKELENTFWVVLRILEERRSLLLKMSEEEASKGWTRSAASKQERAGELETHIGRVKEMLFDATDDKDVRGNQMAGT
jgi:two-component system chemotaxis response regulator CheB